MRSTGLLAALVVAALVTACSAEDEVGIGYLTVADLAAPSQPGHFTGAPVLLKARLAATATGCVTVTVDGVTRMPFWPAGTRLDDSHENPGDYTVTIPNGPTLKAFDTTGDTFTAEGVIDDEGRAFETGGKVDSFLGFCAVKAAPIAFPDASTVTRPGS